VECFEDEGLREQVASAGASRQGPCEYCGSDAKQVDASFFSEMFRRVVRDHFMLLDDRDACPENLYQAVPQLSLVQPVVQAALRHALKK